MCLNKGMRRDGGSGFSQNNRGEPVELILYKTNWCGFCRRVFVALDELSIAVEYRDVGDSKWRDELLDKTGRTQVPCLMINGTSLFESRDIIQWLKENMV